MHPSELQRFVNGYGDGGADWNEHDCIGHRSDNHGEGRWRVGGSHNGNAWKRDGDLQRNGDDFDGTGRVSWERAADVWSCAHAVSGSTRSAWQNGRRNVGDETGER